MSARGKSDIPGWSAQPGAALWPPSHVQTPIMAWTLAQIAAVLAGLALFATAFVCSRGRGLKDMAAAIVAVAVAIGIAAALVLSAAHSLGS